MKTIVLFLLLILSNGTVALAQSAQAGGSTVAVRQSDSLLNGALIGAGAGVASVLFICTRMEPWEVCRDDVATMAKFGALGAGIGMGVDALLRAKVYRTGSGAAEVHAAPILGRGAKGLRLSVQF
jgi:hypothetical protein